MILLYEISYKTTYQILQHLLVHISLILTKISKPNLQKESEVQPKGKSS